MAETSAESDVIPTEELEKVENVEKTAKEDSPSEENEEKMDESIVDGTFHVSEPGSASSSPSPEGSLVTVIAVNVVEVGKASHHGSISLKDILPELSEESLMSTGSEQDSTLTSGGNKTQDGSDQGAPNLSQYESKSEAKDESKQMEESSIVQEDSTRTAETDEYSDDPLPDEKIISLLTASQGKNQLLPDAETIFAAKKMTERFVQTLASDVFKKYEKEEIGYEDVARFIRHSDDLEFMHSFFPRRRPAAEVLRRMQERERADAEEATKKPEKKSQKSKKK